MRSAAMIKTCLEMKSSAKLVFSQQETSARYFGDEKKENSRN